MNMLEAAITPEIKRTISASGEKLSFPIRFISKNACETNSLRVIIKSGRKAIQQIDSPEFKYFFTSGSIKQINIDTLILKNGKNIIQETVRKFEGEVFSMANALKFDFEKNNKNKDRVLSSFHKIKDKYLELLRKNIIIGSGDYSTRFYISYSVFGIPKINKLEGLCNFSIGLNNEVLGVKLDNILGDAMAKVLFSPGYKNNKFLESFSDIGVINGIG